MPISHRAAAIVQAEFVIAQPEVVIVQAEFVIAPREVVTVLLAGSGAVTLIANAVRLPRWADRRQRQMEHIAAHARALTASSSVETSVR